MEEGTLIKWHVKVGDTVSAGDHLADVETDKATMELQAFDDGTVARIDIEEGKTVPIGEIILILAGDGESVEDAASAAASSSGGSAPAAEEAAPAEESAPAAAPVAAPAATPAPGGQIRISPLARKLADEHGLDINTIQGTGPDGRIIKRDVLDAAKGGGAAPAANAPAATPVSVATPASAAIAMPTPGKLEAKTTPLTGMRKTIAKRLVESKTTVPHFQVTIDVDMDPLIALRKTLNAQLEPQGVKLSVNDFVMRAIAVAATMHPEVNSSWTGDAIVTHGTVNVGVAIALPAERGGGLLVATNRDTHIKGLRQISGEVKAIAKKAREQGLTPEEMSDATITLSNLGMYGVSQFTAIINPPNAAIIAVGAAIEKPVVKNGEIVVGHVMSATLSGDHRVIDGALGAEYLQSFKQLIENPAALLV